MLSFNSQNYVVEYKKATPQQWRGEAAKDNRLERVFGLFREPDEINAIGSAMDLVSNLYSGQCEKDYGRRQILFYNEYGELDGVFYDFCATPESEWTEQPEEDVAQSWWVDNKEDTLTFNNKECFDIGNGLKIPVPDGYHYKQPGIGVNAGWSYVVPCDVSLDENHIDAQPYSFGITSDPVSHVPFESKHIEAYKQVFISGGHLDGGVLVESFTVSDHCAFLYQNWYDSEDNLYNKINGFLFAGNDVYQFHIYVNHTEPISQDEDTIAAFLEVGRAWMRQVALREDQAEPIFTPTIPDTQMHDELEIEDNNLIVDEEGFGLEGSVLVGYYGSAVNLLIPSSVSEISDNALTYNQILRSIEIPESVTSIGESAFLGCENLVSVLIPNSVSFIGEAAFMRCPNLRSVAIPDGVTVVGDSMFKGCTSLTGLAIPDSVTTIDDWAFTECENLTSLLIPDSVTSISEYAFYNVGKNLVVYVGKGSYAERYAQEKGLKFVNDRSGAETFSVDINTEDLIPKSPFVLTDKGKTLDKYIGTDTEVEVPDGITTIAGFAFDSTSVVSVVLPESVKKIGNYAFSNCASLKQIKIPTSVKTVEENAFNQCSSLTGIIWPGNVKKIPESACEYCSALVEVVVEEGVTKIEGSAFAFCDNLKDIFLPMSLTKIGDHLLLCAGKPTMHVYSGSYAEKYAKENNLPIEIRLTPEQEAEKQRQEEARRIAEEKYAAELKAWEQTCRGIRAQRERRVSELLEEKRVVLRNEAQSKYDTAIAAAKKRKEAAQQKKTDAEMRLSTLGVFKFAEKKAAKVSIEEAESEMQAAEAALVVADQTLVKDLVAITTAINSQSRLIARGVELEYPLPAKPSK